MGFYESSMKDENEPAGTSHNYWKGPAGAKIGPLKIKHPGPAKSVVSSWGQGTHIKKKGQNPKAENWIRPYWRGQDSYSGNVFFFTAHIINHACSFCLSAATALQELSESSFPHVSATNSIVNVRILWWPWRSWAEGHVIPSENWFLWINNSCKIFISDKCCHSFFNCCRVLWIFIADPGQSLQNLDTQGQRAENA